MTVDARVVLAEVLRGKLRFDEPMARHTSLKVGGPADLFAVPADLADLQALMVVVIETGIPYMVIGGGYNLLVRDGGFRGMVIYTGQLSGIETLPGCRLRAEAGVTNQDLVSTAKEEHLSGLEFLCGIPGTVGGALSMNAGAHGSSVLELVETLTTLQEGKVTVASKEQLRYGYRHLELKPGEIVLGAVFSLAEGNVEEIEARIAACLDQRRSSQKVGHPNAGSFFKNPAGMQAWRLIDEAGLRGYRIGQAQVSEVHSNFLVNLGGATAADFLELEQFIKEKVREKSGLDLEEEVRIFGVD